jgi:hypothetical protein
MKDEKKTPYLEQPPCPAAFWRSILSRFRATSPL